MDTGDSAALESAALEYVLGDGVSAETVAADAFARAADAGEPLVIRVFDERIRRDLLVHPDGETVEHLGDHPVEDDAAAPDDTGRCTADLPTSRADEARNSSLAQIYSAARRHLRDRLTSLRDGEWTKAQSPWNSRRLRHAAAITVAAAMGGLFVGILDHTPAPPATNRPLDTYSGSGPGDRTSGPGVIFAYDYEYYTSRQASAALKYWTADTANQVDPAQLQRDIDAAPTGTRFRLDITATADPLIYNAVLTLAIDDSVTTARQRFHLNRSADGHYLIARRDNCASAC
jgi:hypothetical protein